MKYLVQYFNGKNQTKEQRKKYKNIDYACVEEDKILTKNKNLKWILIENKKTWRILFQKDFTK